MTAFTVTYPRGTTISGSPMGTTAWQLVPLDGELDLFTAPLLRSTLATSAIAGGAGTGLVIDLIEVTFIDSTGLSALATTREQLRASGRDLVLRNPSPMMVRMLDLFGLTEMLEGTDRRPTWRLPC